MNVDSELWHDVNVVTSLLKLFLRKLPRCLLTPGLYTFIPLSLYDLLSHQIYLTCEKSRLRASTEPKKTQKNKVKN